jgi:hypothetical protein
VHGDGAVHDLPVDCPPRKSNTASATLRQRLQEAAA